MERQRSILLVQGDDEDTVRRSKDSDADVLLYDFEHATTHSDHVVHIQDRLRTEPKRCGVRVKGVGTSNGIETIETFASSPHPPDFLMLPGVQSADEVRVVADFLDERGYDIELVVLLESPRALFNAYAIATASPRVVGVSFGPVDFQRSMEVPVLMDIDLYLPRYLIAMAGAGASVAAYDVPLIEGDDELLAEKTIEARSLGYDGKIALDEDQVEVINEAFTPSDEEIERARRIIDTFENTDGRVMVGGRLYGEAAVSQLRELIRSAE